MKKSLLLLVPVALLSGCSLLGIHFNQDTGPEKGKTTSLPPLEVPPDLSVPDFDTRLSIPNEPVSETRADRARRQAAAEPEGKLAESASPADEAPALTKETKSDQGQQKPAKTDAGLTAANSASTASPSLRIQQAGSSRWLEVGATPAQLWPKLKAFWKQEGLSVDRTDTKAGIMETTWQLQPAVSSSEQPGGTAPQTREKYRVRLQKETGAVTNIYIGQLSARKTGNKKTSWKSLPSDQDKESEALERLTSFLSGEAIPLRTPAQETARVEPVSPPKPETPDISIQDIAGVPALVIQDDFGDAWSLTESALSRSGLKVENRDRNRGLYFVKAVGKVSGQGVELQPGGKFQLHLLDQGHRTLITAHSTQDKALEQSSARAVLMRIKQAFTAPATTAQSNSG